MRHAVDGRKLNRSSAHRLALRRNLVQSLFEHERVRTTLVKAREVRRFAERLVTLAIRGDLPARRRAIALLADRAIIPKAHQAEYDRLSDAKRDRVLRSRSGRRHRANAPRHGLKFSAESVVARLFAVIGPRMKKRNEARGCAGGYTRIIKLSDRRVGDATPLALLELVGEEDKPRPKSSDKTERKRRARVRYAAYAGKPAPRRGAKRATGKAARPSAAAPPAPAQDAVVSPPPGDAGGA